jgi:hypothetical protein
VVGWFLAFLGVFIVGMVYGYLVDPGEAVWARFWHVYLFISFGLLAVSTVWLGIGGLKDVRNLFTSLQQSGRDFSDTGEMKHESQNEKEGTSHESGGRI